MNKKLLIALSVVIILAIAGVAGYAFLTSPTKAPTQPVSENRPPIGGAGGAPQPTASLEMPGMDAPSGTYRIVPENSKVTFTIHEELRGEPKTVVATNNFIGGFFEVDQSDLTLAKISAIKINARGFTTDSSQRDNTTRRAILKTEDNANEYIIFTPTAIADFSTPPEGATDFTFKITGNLLISGTTKQVTFEGIGSFPDESTFTGSAKTTVKRSDYNLIVPSFPFLANVGDDVDLEIDFKAKK